MLDKALSLVVDGADYVRNHPQLLVTLLLLIIIPVSFVWSGIQFLDVSKQNQDTLEKSRIGLMHDLFVSVMVASEFNIDIIGAQMINIAGTNPDITKFIVAKETSEGIVRIASLDTSHIGTIEENTELYDFSRVRSDETLIFPFFLGDTRYWQAFRSFKTPGNETYFLMTEYSFAGTDTLFETRELSAYIWLTVLLLVISFLLYRQVRLIDYSYMYKEAQKAIETKDLFTNMIAHELRAPLTAMRGYASLIYEKKDVDEKTREQASRIGESSERLILIVNDLLDVARIQSGKLAVTKSVVNVSGVVRTVIDTIAASANEKNIQLVGVGTDDAHMVIGDEKRLIQAITNLVSNAIKYTEKGSIEISLTDRRDRVELRVKDTGMGISAEDQQKLFAPFFRVESQSVSQITGTGLGMWITKQLIELMGASIGVESIKGVGTHIVVTLPKIKKSTE